MKTKIKWDTPIEKFKKWELYALGEAIFNFCRREVGLSPRGGAYPCLFVHPRKKSKCYGEYCPSLHMVEIYAGECENLRWFVDTVIHEYVHSCQPWIGVRYSALSSKVGYRKNPFEIEARKVAKETRTKCIQFLREKFNSKT